jgi:hypothetical protein
MLDLLVEKNPRKIPVYNLGDKKIYSTLILKFYFKKHDFYLSFNLA